MVGQKLAKMLVAIDGSSMSDYALNVAIKIGEKFSSRIDLLHVTMLQGAVAIPPPVFDPILGTSTMSMPPAGLATPEETAAATRRDEALLSERRNLVLARNLECSTTIVRSDDVGGEILKQASSGAYDLIALGSRGLGGLRSLILGSVSSKVAKEAKCSVLVVKAKIEGMPKILLGYDGSPESNRALELAAEIGKKFNAQVDPVSVVNVPISPEGYVVSEMDHWQKEMKDLADGATAILRAAGVNASGKVIDSVDVSRALVEEAERGNYNIIAIGSRGRGRLRALFLGSVASGVANSAKTNILIVR